MNNEFKKLIQEIFGGFLFHEFDFSIGSGNYRGLKSNILTLESATSLVDENWRLLKDECAHLFVGQNIPGNNLSEDENSGFVIYALHSLKTPEIAEFARSGTYNSIDGLKWREVVTSLNELYAMCPFKIVFADERYLNAVFVSQECAKREMNRLSEAIFNIATDSQLDLGFKGVENMILEKNCFELFWS